MPRPCRFCPELFFYKHGWIEKEEVKLLKVGSRKVVSCLKTIHLIHWYKNILVAKIYNQLKQSCASSCVPSELRYFLFLLNQMTGILWNSLYFQTARLISSLVQASRPFKVILQSVFKSSKIKTRIRPEWCGRFHPVVGWCCSGAAASCAVVHGSLHHQRALFNM